MSEQNKTPQVEEVAAVDAGVQPDSAQEPAAPVEPTKVVEPETSNLVEEPASSDVAKEVVAEKPVESEKVEPEVEKDQEKPSDDKPVAEVQESEKVSDEKTAEPVSCPVKAPVEKVNGDGPKEPAVEAKVDEPVVEVTNGVCKRKSENGGAEVVEDEKSPKKAKVVDDGDQAPVEETAA